VTAGIVAVPSAEKSQLAAMMADYLAEMATLLQLTAAFDPRLERYWGEPGQRWAYWIVDDGEKAGFVLVRHDQENSRFEVAEFFVVPHVRRRGIGIAAARAVLRRHPGQWRITQWERNPNAIAFWHRVLAIYPFEERTTSTDAVRREQRFLVPAQ
jgi:predicted acetyltransferase